MARQWWGSLLFSSAPTLNSCYPLDDTITSRKHLVKSVLAPEVAFMFTFLETVCFAGHLSLFCNLWWWHASWTRPWQLLPLILNTCSSVHLFWWISFLRYSWSLTILSTVYLQTWFHHLLLWCTFWHNFTRFNTLQLFEVISPVSSWGIFSCFFQEKFLRVF